MNPSNNDSGASSPSGMAWRLQELLRSSSGGGGRRLSFLALDPARKHFGHDWPRVSIKVHGIVTSTLRTFLSEGDIYSAADEMSYIIISNNRVANEFDKLMEDISSEISSKIIGKGIAKELVSIIHLNSGEAAENYSKREAVQSSSDGDAGSRMGNIERIINESVPGNDEFKFSSVTYGCFPVLSTDTMSTSSLLCLAMREDQDGVTHYGYDTLPPESDTLLYAEMDALTVEFASKQIKETTDRHLIVQIPVHRMTLSSKKYREMYIKICQGILASRRDRVIFDIYGIDEGTPSNRIAEYMQWLRPYARTAVVTVDVDFSMVSVFSGVNIASVGADMRVMESDTAMLKIGKFVNRVKAASMKSHIHGISSKQQADICLRLGIDYLDSELIPGKAGSSKDSAPPAV